MSKFQNFNYTDTGERATTIRNPNSALLLVDSADRYNLNTDGSYDASISINPNNILINHQRTLGAGQIKRIAVTEFSFPWVTPNVNARNNRLFFKEQTTNDYYYITIPEDFYTPSELAAAFQTALNAGLTNYQTGVVSAWNAPWVVGVNAKTSNFSISSDAVGTLWRITSPDGVGQSLGGLSGLSGATVYATSRIGSIPSMSYTQYIDVCSKTLTKFQNLKDSLTQLNYTDIVCRIYLQNNLNTPTADTTYFASRPCINLCKEFSCPKYILWNENEMVFSIDIQLYDDSGELLYIPQQNWNLDYLFTIQMSES